MSKNFMQDGKWIDNPNKVAVSVCKCKSKYVKTRDGQTACLRCMSDVIGSGKKS